MCGIVGIVSAGDNVSADLVHGISRLEYRGYDSCGVAIKNGVGIVVSKDVGGPSKLTDQGFFEGLNGSIGIAHTRWATHGGVSRDNAHPHVSSDGRVAIAHNGVLLNYRELRKQLHAAGMEFQSQTDSEVAANLIAHQLSDGTDVREALLGAARQLEGTYGIAIMLEDQPDKLWALRNESPLVVGFSNGRVLVASDPLALGASCEEIVYVEDGELVELTVDECRIFRIEDGSVVERERKRVTSFEEEPRLGEFSHFMAKEMSETGVAIRSALNLDQEQIDQAARTILSSRRAFLTGMGTAYHMAYFGHHLLARYARVFCPVVTSDELPSVAWFEAGDAVLGVSQSGETYDTLRALRLARKSGATTLAVCNVAASSMAREVNHVLLQAAGPEVAVLATKSASSQAAILARIAIEAGRQNGSLDEQAHQEALADLERLPDVVDEWCGKIDEQSRETAARFLGLEKWFFLGRGVYSAVAMEGALKFKEVTYRHAEGMAAGFLKHGTISLIDPEMGTAMFLPPPSSGELRQMTMTALEEVRSRGGPVLAVGCLNEEQVGQVDACVQTPGESELIDAMLQILAGQYLSYHTARALGRDVDRPRALAKSVTVP